MSDTFTIKVFYWEQFSRSSYAQWPTAPRLHEGATHKQEHDRLPPNTKAVTKAVWEALPWNPMLGFDYTDPDTGAKPSWAEVVAAYKFYMIDSAIFEAPGYSTEGYIETYRHQLAAAAHLINDNEVDVGHGLSHMPSLIHLLDASDGAGAIMPIVSLRKNTDLLPTTVHLKRHMREFIFTMAEHRNLVESAHNRIIKPFITNLARFRDSTLKPQLRYDIGVELETFWQEYPLKLKAEMRKLDTSDFLPDDIDELREKYSELISAAATARFAQITDSIGRQDTILHASCYDQREAIEKISLIRQQVQITLAPERASTKEQLDAAYEAGLDLIANVEVANVPVFHLVPQATPVENSQRFTGRQLLIKADHPADTDNLIPGLVSAHVEVVAAEGEFSDTGTASVAAIGTSSPVLITLNVTGNKPVKFVITARNVCGPAVISVIVVPPAS